MPLFKPETFGATTFVSSSGDNTICCVPEHSSSIFCGCLDANTTPPESACTSKTQQRQCPAVMADKAQQQRKPTDVANSGFYTDKKPESSPTFISGIDTNSGSVTEQEKCWGTIGFPDKGKQQREYNESNSESEGEAEARELGLEFRRSYARYLRFKRDLAENIINLDEWLLCNGEQKEEEILSVAVSVRD